MKKLLILSFLILGPALQSRAQEQAFTAQEQAVIDACVTNISEKVYSPAEADKCLTGLNNNNFNLLDRLQTADEPRARYILTYENAIKDLSDFFEDANGVNVINKGLIVRLERADCALCSLDMGPQPEKLMPWVSRYASDKAEQAKQASFAWDTLSPETRTFLPKDGITPETWSERYISDRMDDLRTWATAKFDEIMPPGAVRFDAEKHTPTVKAILPYLNREQRARITAAYNRITTDMKKASEQSNSPEKTATAAKYDKMQEKINKLSARPDNEQSDFLGKTFDNTTPGTGKTGPRSPAGAKTAAEASAGGAIGKAYTLTDEQAKELSPRMQKTLLGSDKEAGELSDTAVGRKAIAFYAKPENKLKFSIADLKDEHTRGAYNPAEGTVTINKDYVEKAMKQTGVTADQLMDEKNDTAIKKVTRYVAPTFVHEGLGHQGQAAWARENNVPDHYYLGQETEAFSYGSLYVLQKGQAEKAKGNLNYSSQISESDIARADLMKSAGTIGIRKSIMYYEVPSQLGKAAQNFAGYESAKKELTLREKAMAADPAKEKLADEERPGIWTTAALKQKLNTAYPWYKLAVNKSEEETRYFQDSLDDIRGTGGKPGSLTTKPVSRLL